MALLNIRRSRVIPLFVGISVLFIISLWSFSDFSKPVFLRKSDSLEPAVDSRPLQSAIFIVTIVFILIVDVSLKSSLRLEMNSSRLEFETNNRRTKSSQSATQDKALICTRRNSPSTTEQNDMNNPSKPKLVLFNHFAPWYKVEQASGFSAFSSCEHKCELTANASRLAEADTVIFYNQYGWPMPPPVKRQGQKWVFFAVEPPPYSNAQFKDPAWHQLFNWTMGYRLDSEIWHGYVRMMKKKTPTPEEDRAKDIQHWKELFAKKTKMVAWFVSHCETQSLREKYVQELSKYIQVDIYGKCGPLKCSNRAKCLNNLTNEYKFYLAFENSFCVDYATEKLLNILKMSTLIPVVRGGADYHRIFPVKSMVVSSDFSSPESLAKYLLALANDEEAYINHFRWSWDYYVEGNGALPFCDVCKQMYKTESTSCVYNDVHSWHMTDTCFPPNDL